MADPVFDPDRSGDAAATEIIAGDAVATLVADLRAAIAAQERPALLEALADVHEADIADALEQVSATTRAEFVALAGDAFPVEVFAELDEGLRDEFIALLPDAFLAEAVGELESDDAVYLVENLEAEQRADILDSLPIPERIAIERALEYPDYSAGRMMQTDLVAIPPFWSVGQTIDMMRSRDDLPDQYYDLIVVDPSFRPLGMVPLSKLMASRRPVKIEAIMADSFHTVSAEDTQEDVAYVFNQYSIVSTPVIDEAGRLIGVITIDDAMEAHADESEEDMRRLAGLGDEELTDSVLVIARQRLPWLAVNLITAILASLVIARFDAVIEQIVALAVLMTIIASMGGNAGTQTLTVAVRALATKSLTATNAVRIISREAAVGLINGAAFAVVMGAASWAWFGDPALGLVLGAAMIINMFVAALAGILIPLGLERAGADPALASAVFVTTVTDVVGFFAFLGLAAAILL